MKTGMNREQLNSLDKDTLVSIVLQLQAQIDEMSANIASMNRNLELMMEQLKISRNAQFGKKTEVNTTDEEQLSFFNEAEMLKTDSPEPELEVAVPGYTRKKRKGKWDEDLKDFPTRSVPHEIPEEELKGMFPEGYKHMPDEIYRKLEFHPATFEVVEHHIKVYKSRKDGRIVKASHPKELLDKSYLTPSLAAAVMNAKYTNHIPLNRQEKEFERNDVHISRQDMANWMIKIAERYLSLIYDRFKEKLFESDVIHADETPVGVRDNGREDADTSHMWVYRSGTLCGAVPVILYDYRNNRSQETPREYLRGYTGFLVCDGYQVYHKISEERPDELTVAGCWVHAKRYFSKAVSAVGKEQAKDTVAGKALTLISKIFHEDNKLDELNPEERLRERKVHVEPLVDAFFAWAKEHRDDVTAKSETGKGFTYLFNQEKYLRTFLTDGRVPMDNNAAEQAIRDFVIGRKNWMQIDTKAGAEASAMIYGIVETCKANDIKIYDYLEHVLTVMPEHMDDTNTDFLDDLLPWSENLPEKLKKKQQNS